MIKIAIFPIIFFGLFLNIQAENWPSNINIIIKSTCVIEYYQPQTENLEIKDRTRIKRNLTGLLVRDDGLILTSDEIYPANLDISSNSISRRSQKLPEDITVIFEDNRKFKATFLGKDEESKLAFIKINDSESLPKSINFISSSSHKIGQPLFLIERLDKRFDFKPIVTQKNINSVLTKPKKRLLINSSLKALSDCGLVLNKNGKAIGIIQNNKRSHIYDHETLTSKETVIEVLLADDFNKLISKPPTMSALKKGIGKSWLGIQMQILKKDMAEYWGLSETSGIIINKILPNSPAEIGGLKIGDIITSIDKLQLLGDDDENLAVFKNYVRNLPEGSVDVQFIRGGKLEKAKLNLRSTPMSQFLAEELPVEEFGFSVKELTQDIFLNYNIDFDTEGVWVSRIEAAGIANIAGLLVGDLIIKVNDYSVKDLDSFKGYINNVVEINPKYIQLFILRHNKTLFLYLKNRHDNNIN